MDGQDSTAKQVCLTGQVSYYHFFSHFHREYYFYCYPISYIWCGIVGTIWRLDLDIACGSRHSVHCCVEGTQNHNKTEKGRGIAKAITNRRSESQTQNHFTFTHCNTPSLYRLDNTTQPKENLKKKVVFSASQRNKINVVHDNNHECHESHCFRPIKLIYCLLGY